MQQIIYQGETWNVAGVGVVRDGKVYVALASTTTFFTQKNGKVPKQIGDWIDLKLAGEMGLLVWHDRDIDPNDHRTPNQNGQHILLNGVEVGKAQYVRRAKKDGGNAWVGEIVLGDRRPTFENKLQHKVEEWVKETYLASRVQAEAAPVLH